MSTTRDDRSCNCCGKKCLDLRKITLHEMMYSQEKPFKCETCYDVSQSLSSSWMSEEKQTLLAHTNKYVATLETGSFFKEPQLLKEDGCNANEMTEDVGTKLQGIISNPSVKRLRHICPVCQMSLAKAETLKSHIAAHFSNTFSSCKTCHMNFKTENALRRHRSLIHAKMKNHSERKQNLRKFVQSSRITPRQRISKKVTLEAKLMLSQKPIHVHRSPSEDPHLWPKVFLSGRLNNLLKLGVSL